MKFTAKILISYLIILFIINCTQKKQAVITKEFIINPSWDKIDNSIRVEKMLLKSGEMINLSNVTPTQLLQKLETDTSSAYTANVKFNGTDYSLRKVYFNKNNGFKWRKRPDLDPSRKLIFDTIGELEKETWYLLGGLSSEKTLYYIFIDSLNNLHQYKVSDVHWTNI